MTGFGEKSVKNAPNMAFFGALRANRSAFCSFTAKVLKKKISFEIHVITIATSSLSFGLKNEFFWPLSFFGLEFFRKC